MLSHPPVDAIQTKRYEGKRELILNAAAVVFNERGLRGATFADVAGSVGLLPALCRA
jgi:AcrR family transcriptional regulator